MATPATTPTPGLDLSLADLLAATGGVPHGGSPALRFSDVATDSRRVTPGALFVALRGETTDGHRHLAAALAAGAGGALVERIPQDVPPASDGAVLVVVPDTYLALQDLGRARRRRLDPLVVGITGSVGKTTTKEVVADVLGARFRVLRTRGNLNTEVGLPIMLLHATPAHEVLVLEMGMYVQGDIRLLAEIARPRVGVVTNVGPVHLERLGTLERIRQTKQELVEALPPDGTAVLNLDDPRVRGMAAATAARALYYGRGEPDGVASDAAVLARDVHSRGLDGVDFALVHAGRRLAVHLPLLGAHTVYAATAAVAVALSLGMSLEESAAALEALSQPPRLALLPGRNGSRILDDTYNASPASVNAALDLLAELEGRKIAVLGDMFELGSAEESGHREVGRHAADRLDALVTVGSRARWIAEEARAAGAGGATIEAADDRAGAVAWLAPRLRPGDVVLVKGSRGMQMEQVVAALRAEPEAAGR